MIRVRRGSGRRTVVLLGAAAFVAVAPELATDTMWRLAGVSSDRAATRSLSPLPSGHPWPRTFLVVGTDSRDRFRNRVGDLFGPADTLEGERADSLMLVRVADHGEPVRILSLPRDLLVDVLGYGPQRLSTALEYGGPALLIRTVRALTSLPIHHYLDVDFLGFTQLVDRVGGVDIVAETPVRDGYSGLKLQAGPQRLDGWMTLALVRARNAEEWRDGSWVPAAQGDRARLTRQQQVITALASQVRDRGRSVWKDAAALGRVGRHVRVDSRLEVSDALALLRAVTGSASARLDVLPTEPALDENARTSPFPPAHIGTLNYQRMLEPAARRTLEGFAA